MIPENIKPMLIFCGGFCAAKLFSMYRMLTGTGGEYAVFSSDITWPILLGILKGDSMVMCLLAYLMILLTISKKPPVKFLISIIFVVLLATYVIDFFCLVLLNNRLILLDLPKFIKSFPMMSVGLFMLVLYLSIALLRPSWKGVYDFEKNNLLIPGYFLLFYLVPFEPDINYLKYDFLTKNIINNNLELTYLIDYDSTTDLAEQYINSFKPVVSDGARPNIILLILESGSSIDSLRTAGIKNYLPRLDAIQANGITYTNFIANSNTTDTGLISILKGINTIPFSANTDNYQTYKTDEIPIPEYLNQNGYNTSFLTTGPLSFLDKKSFLESVGYTRITGAEFFSDKKKYTFYSAADEHLYHAALDEIHLLHKSDKPYFLTLLTISQHLVYYTPYGYGKSNMYKYTDDTLGIFYEDLKDMGFFESGLLVIVGDHRKMTPLEEGEYEKFGLSAHGRIICTVVGKGIPENIIDNNIYQQTDIYYSLKRLIADKLINAPQYNDLFLGGMQRPFATHSLFSDRSTLVVITKEETCTVYLNGDNTRFNDCRAYTIQHPEILDSINKSRAYQFHLAIQ